MAEADKHGKKASASPRSSRAPGSPRAARPRPGSRPGASRSTARRSPRRRSTSARRQDRRRRQAAAGARTHAAVPLSQAARPRDLAQRSARPTDHLSALAEGPAAPHQRRAARPSTEGLLLLTNDGGLARALELPATGWLRRYRVRAHGKVTQPQLDELRDGVTVDGIHYGPIEATLDREQASNVWITFAIREGKNREVRNVLRHLGLHVTRLIRVSFGPFQLGELPEGEVDEVPTRMLREQLGERVAALSNADFSAAIIARPQPEVARNAAQRSTAAAGRFAKPAGSSPAKQTKGSQIDRSKVSVSFVARA